MREIRILLISTIISHYLVFISFILTAILGFFVMHWFVAITLDALIFRVIFSQSECPLTTLENYYRMKLKLVNSKGFLKDYIIHPKQTITYLIREFNHGKN